MGYDIMIIQLSNSLECFKFLEQALQVFRVQLLKFRTRKLTAFGT